MQLWLFFVIFGLVLFVPAGLLFLLLNRLKNTIVVLFKQNGSIKRIVITNKTLSKGQITSISGKKIKPISVSKDEIYYGRWRRFIIKPELESKQKSSITDKEVEEYLNNEDLIKLYLAGKFKDTLLMMMTAILITIIIAAVINGYLTNSHQCILTQDNATTQYLSETFKNSLRGLKQI